MFWVYIIEYVFRLTNSRCLLMRHEFEQRC